MFYVYVFHKTQTSIRTTIEIWSKCMRNNAYNDILFVFWYNCTRNIIVEHNLNIYDKKGDCDLQPPFLYLLFKKGFQFGMNKYCIMSVCI